MDEILHKLDLVPTAIVRHASALEDAVAGPTRRTAASGQAPDGTAWPRTRTGEAPLKNAEGSIQSSHATRGARVVVKLKVVGHHALHHMGRANGAPRRQIIPDKLTAEARARLDAIVRGALA